MPALLATLAAGGAALRAFTLDVYLEDPAELAALDWARVDAALARPRPAAPAAFELILRSRALSVAEVALAVRARMPALAARGLVSVRACPGK